MEQLTAAQEKALSAEKEAAAMPRSNTVGEISTDDLGEWSPNSSLPTSVEFAWAGSVSCLTPAAARLRVRLVSGLRRASLPNGATLSVNRGACGAADLAMAPAAVPRRGRPRGLAAARAEWRRRRRPKPCKS